LLWSVFFQYCKNLEKNCDPWDHHYWGWPCSRSPCLIPLFTSYSSYMNHPHICVSVSRIFHSITWFWAMNWFWLTNYEKKNVQMGSTLLCLSLNNSGQPFNQVSINFFLGYPIKLRISYFLSINFHSPLSCIRDTLKYLYKSWDTLILVSEVSYFSMYFNFSGVCCC